MRYEDFILQFNRQAFKLDSSKQLNLAISICKKLYFDYQKFTEVHNWGNPGMLLDFISLIEKSRDGVIDRITINEAIEKLDSITPHMDDFGDNISSYALNACVAVYETLQFLIEPHPKHIYDIGIALTDSVDFKIQEDIELTEEEIDKHPMMIEARNFLVQGSK